MRAFWQNESMQTRQHAGCRMMNRSKGILFCFAITLYHKTQQDFHEQL
jgi:hypothetical protein